MKKYCFIKMKTEDKISLILLGLWTIFQIFNIFIWKSFSLLIFPIIGILFINFCEHIFDKEKKYTFLQKLTSAFKQEKPEWTYGAKVDRMEIMYNKLSNIEKTKFLNRINNIKKQ